MMNWITAVITLAVLWGQQDTDESASASFRSDLEALKEYFHIPGMAAIVTQNGTVIYENYTGQADLDTGRPVDSTTVFPINSLTKTYAAVLIMQLVEAGQLDLDQPVNRYLEDSDLPDSIKIKHFLSHTSEGIPGNFYNYSGFRYHLLAQVLERVTGRQFDLLMNDRILEPQGLSDTHLLLDQARLEALDDRIAKPYFYSGEIQNGQYETAKSASMGLASTARDIAKFDKALSAGKLLSDKSRSEMFTPFPISNGNSPYGFGVFSQVFLGKQLIWGYGQGEYSSSLMLKVIEDDLTLIILANNNQMSDPARLLNGDVTYSLFALSFLKHFVFDLPEKSDWSNLGPEQLDVALSQSAYGPFYRQEHLASALAAAQNGFNDGDSMEVNRSKELVTLALEHFPNYNSYGTQPLMFLIKNL
ncbi:MAG: beta-lactamase family protein, partial [Candidatus Latescibacteria bacterium]|nr:beta-lactamase family protein [Candidatus Latescibacterota bacterium]